MQEESIGSVGICIQTSSRASNTAAAAGGVGESGGPADPPGLGGDGGFLGDDSAVTKLGFSGGRGGGGGGGGGGVGFIVVSASVTPSIDPAAQISPTAIDSIAAP